MKIREESGIHVAIIMDGNGRWATRQGLSRVAGHRAGVAAVRRTVESAPELGVRVLTIYAFSSDNWARPAQEVESILWIIRAFLRLECERLRRNGVRLEVADAVLARSVDVVVERKPRLDPGGDDRIADRVSLDRP